MKKILIAVAALVVAAFVLSNLLRPTAQVSVVRPGRAINAVPGSVTVQAEYQMELKSEASGRVIRSELDPGKAVTTGMMLVQMDTGDLELEIQQIESDYEALKKRIAIGSALRQLQMETTDENLRNFERSAKEGNFPQAELEKQRRAVKELTQRQALEDVENNVKLSTSENTLKAKRRQLDKMTITAQFDGKVANVYARPGDLIGNGASLATIIATKRTVEAKISEENFAGIKVGQNATVRFLGYGDGTYDASVVKILPTADPLTQRYIVHLDVKKIDPEKLIPGLTGEANIIVGERDAQALIPRRALIGDQVFVVQDGRVRLRKVEPGYVLLNIAEITKGLSPGDQVVVEELDQFRDGDRVRTEVVK